MKKKKAKKLTSIAKLQPAPHFRIRKTHLIMSALGLLLFVSVSTAAAYHITQLPESAFLPYITVDGVDLTGITTFKEASSQVLKTAQTFLRSPLTLESERGTLSLTPQDAGISLNVEDIQEQLLAFPQTSTAFEKIRTYLFGEDFELAPRVDETALKTALAAAPIEQGKKNATFTAAGTTLSITPEQIGYGVDLDTFVHNLQIAWQKKLTEVELPLLTSEPTVLAADLQPLLASAQLAVTQSFTLTDDYGNDYPIALADHLDWLIPGSTNVFGLQQEAFITYVQTQLAPHLEEDPSPVTITETTPGTYAFEGSARFGQKIDTLALQDTLETKLQIAVAPEPLAAGSEPPSTQPKKIVIPVTRTMPEVTVPDSLKALGVTDLVGVGYSDFSGSPSGRVHNINQGINQFNGVLIQKGAEFSFMDHLSPVDAEHGFLPELVIKGDETIPEFGGGMCQVSSTMFRAALYSGLPITARTNHSYAVSYYARPFGYGLDATVYDPKPDFKFINDTPGALLVQSYTEGNSAYYVFYGTNDGRRVTMDGPRAYNYNSVPDQVTQVDTLAPGERELKEHGHQGFEVDWTRTITRADGTVATENIHSSYEARPEKWEEGQSAAALPTE